MRAVLHHRDFQALEAAWRAAYFLIRRLDTDSSLSIHLVDTSKQELAADLQADDLRSSGIYKLMVDQTVGTPGGQRWSVIVGNYSFGRNRDDVELLSRMSAVARQAGVPFVAAAHSSVVGCDSFAAMPDPDAWSLPADSEGDTAWEEFRRLPQASYAGLALPRFLLRLPYGKASNPVERFDFDELPEVTSSTHDQYLWGNSAFACCCLLAQSFTEQGWSMRPGSLLELEGMPVHVYRSDGESEARPSSEALLTERAAERIVKHGLMPLLSYRSRDIVRFGCIRSLANAPAGLRGPWSAEMM
jgi:type VI secretion system protein ImpC